MLLTFDTSQPVTNTSIKVFSFLLYKNAETFTQKIYKKLLECLLLYCILCSVKKTNVWIIIFLIGIFGGKIKFYVYILNAFRGRFSFFLKES